MCYSGKCWFEDHMGDCRSWKYDSLFRNVPKHWGVCTLGEFSRHPEEEEYIEQQKHNLVFQYCQKLALGRIKITR